MGQIRPRFGGIGTVRCAPDSGLRGAFPDRRRCAGTGRSAYPRRLRPRPTALHLLKIYLYGYSTAFSGLLFPNREQPPPPSFDDLAPAAVALHGWSARVAPREGGFDRRRYSPAPRLIGTPRKRTISAREVSHGQSRERCWSAAGRRGATARVWRSGARPRWQDVATA